MRQIFVICLLAISATGFAQEKSENSPYRYKTDPGTPLMVVSGDEIRRFPSGNFLDAVNGLFPWVFSQDPDTNQFLFIVNGFILADVNGLSLNDIEQVIFSRNSINGSNYPYSRAGTFYIKTKTVNSTRPVISFNSQYNTSWNKRARLFYTDANGVNPGLQTLINESDNKPGHFISNHLSVAAGNEKFHFYSGIQWDDVKQPPIRQKTIAGNQPFIDTAAGSANSSRYDLKGYLNLEYRFSDKIQAGVSGNYFFGRSKQNISLGGDFLDGGLYSQTSSAPAHLNNFQTGAFINWQPLPQLRNRLFFEYADNDFGYNSELTYYSKSSNGQANTIYSTTDADATTHTYTLRNQLEYDLPLRGKFKAGIAAWFTYMQGKVNYRQSVTQSSGSPGPVFSSSWTHYKQKLTSLNPQLYFSYDSVISGYFGYGFLLNKGISEFSSRSRSNPYAGLLFDIKRALKIRGQKTSMELSAHYADLTRNQSNSYWLPEIDNQTNFYPGSTLTPIYVGSGGVFVPNPSLSRMILKNRMTSVGLHTGFNYGRIMAGIEWSKLETQQVYLLQLIGFPNPTTMAVLGEKTTSGISGYVSAGIIREAKRTWDIRFNVLIPDTKEKLEGAGPGPSVFNFNTPGYAAQTGLQNSFRFSQLFVQVNALLGFNRNYYAQEPAPGYNVVEKKINEININYLLVGYDFTLSKSSLFKDFSVFAQARNLLGSKDTKQFNQYASSAGVGVNLTFK